jgi:alanyl-tRNA synthetase
MLSSKQIREMFLNFMASKGHKIISSSSMVPKEDPTVLFIGSGMQPLVPYLMGTLEHPNGSRLTNSQKCLRTVDIDGVGDNRHCTFFEMLGNWSIGDYFKEESISWSLEFLTSKNWLNLDVNRIFVTTFKGSKNAPEDLESVAIWQREFEKLGIKAGISKEFDFKNVKTTDNFKLTKITQKGVSENWWGLPYRGPCGGDSEIFYLKDSIDLNNFENDVKKMKPLEAEQYLDDNLIEIWNNVFMEYEGQPDENGNPFDLKPLKQKNVDTGMGLERLVAFLNKKEDVYETDLFMPILEVIEKWKG